MTTLSVGKGFRFRPPGSRKNTVRFCVNLRTVLRYNAKRFLTKKGWRGSRSQNLMAREWNEDVTTLSAGKGFRFRPPGSRKNAVRFCVNLRTVLRYNAKRFLTRDLHQKERDPYRSRSFWWSKCTQIRIKQKPKPIYSI